MAVDTKQIQELLGTGLSNEVVASAVGVDPSYISQLMSDPQFSDEVIAKRSKALTAHSARDLTWDGLEDRLLHKLSGAIDYMVKPEVIMKALSLVNRAVRRGVPVNTQLTSRTQVIALSLPPVVRRNFIIDQQGQIVEAEGATLVTMNSAALLSRLKESRSGGEKYAKLAEQISQDELPVVRSSIRDASAFQKMLATPLTQNLIQDKEELRDVSIEDL